MLFAVGLKLKGKSDHVVVDGEDALIAALKAKAKYPEAASPTLKLAGSPRGR